MAYSRHEQLMKQVIFNLPKHLLREIRGENSVYHNNCIQTWHLKTTGEVENVEVS